jgi:hypothetical protein
MILKILSNNLNFKNDLTSRLDLKAVPTITRHNNVRIQQFWISRRNTIKE